ncbi:hypothetical protein Vafri_11646, partial [Volvox africanus]
RVLSNRSCGDGQPAVGQPAGGVVVSELQASIEHFRAIAERFLRKRIPVERPLRRFGKLKDEESLTLQERLCARRQQMTEKGILFKVLLPWRSAPEELGQLRGQPEAQVVPAAQQELQQASEEDMLQASEEDMQQASEEDMQQASEEDMQQASEEDMQQASEEDMQQASEQELQQASEQDMQQASEEDMLQASEEDMQQASEEDM